MIIFQNVSPLKHHFLVPHHTTKWHTCTTTLTAKLNVRYLDTHHCAKHSLSPRGLTKGQPHKTTFFYWHQFTQPKEGPYQRCQLARKRTKCASIPICRHCVASINLGNRTVPFCFESEWAPQSAATLVCSLTMESRESLAHALMYAFPHMPALFKTTQTWSKWQLTANFCDFQMSVFNELDHKLTGKLVRVGII